MVNDGQCHTYAIWRLRPDHNTTHKLYYLPSNPELGVNSLLEVHRGMFMKAFGLTKYKMSSLDNHFKCQQPYRNFEDRRIHNGKHKMLSDKVIPAIKQALNEHECEASHYSAIVEGNGAKYFFDGGMTCVDLYIDAVRELPPQVADQMVRMNFIPGFYRP